MTPAILNNSKVENVMEKMQEDIHRLTRMVEDIYRLIAGHELDKDSGMIHQVKDHEERITILEKYKDKQIYMGLGLAIAMGLSTGLSVAGVMKIIAMFAK